MISYVEYQSLPYCGAEPHRSELYSAIRRINSLPDVKPPPSSRCG